MTSTNLNVQSSSIPNMAIDRVHAPETAWAVNSWDLTKVYGTGPTAVHALRGASAHFEAGRFSAIMGPSGSGKSTLLHMIAGLDKPTSGRVVVGGKELGVLNDKKLTELRRDRIGFVFQAFNLIPTLTAEENIRLTSDLAGRRIDPAWFDHVIDTVGLRDRLTHKPGEMSGGQRQRVAIARALVTRPAVIVADEPTGNLDSNSSAEVLGLLRDAVRVHGQTVVMVTHDPAAAAYADRVLFLADGQIRNEIHQPTIATIAAAMTNLGA